MNNALLGLVVAVVLGAQLARADDYNDYNSGYGAPHDAVPVQQGARGCGPRPTRAPAGQNYQAGHYELQNVQQWVPGQQTQVWVAGTCREGGHRRRHWRACTPGAYRTVWTAGHYETTQQWVWVTMPPAPQPRYGAVYGTAGIKVQSTNGSFAMTVY